MSRPDRDRPADPFSSAERRKGSNQMVRLRDDLAQRARPHIGSGIL